MTIKAQEYIDTNYNGRNSHNRVNVKSLNLSNKNLTGTLKIKDFLNLTRLNCSSNKLTEITIINCPHLNSIDLTDNPIIEANISDLGNSNYQIIGYKKNPVNNLKRKAQESSDTSNKIEDNIEELSAKKYQKIKLNDFEEIIEENKILKEKLLKFEINEKKFLLKKKINRLLDNDLGYFVFETYFLYNDKIAKNLLLKKIAHDQIKNLISEKEELLSLEKKLNANNNSNDNNFLDSSQDKYLDILARLLTGNEKCVALCFFENNLVISNCNNTLSHAKLYLEILENFISKPSITKYKSLLILALHSIRNSSIESFNISNYNRDLIVFQRLSLEISEKKTKDEWVNLQKSIDNIFLKIIEDKNSIKTEIWRNFLKNWCDTIKIASSVFKKNLSEKIIEAIKNKKIIYLENNEKLFKLHAEMKIISFIHEKGIKRRIYIGINKISCLNCNRSIKELNKEGFSIATYNNESHCGKYDGWTLPKFLEGKRKEILESKKEGSLIKTLTNSEIPKHISSINAIDLFEQLIEQENYQNLILSL